MVKREDYKSLINYTLIIGLFVIAFIILRPVFFAIVYGVLLAYIFYPLYRFLLSKLKNENLSAALVCFIILTLAIVLIILMLISLLNQLINFYVYIQEINLSELIESSLPSFLSSSDISPIVTKSISSSISKILSNLASTTGSFILNLPTFLLKALVTFIIFFFGLRDGEKAYEYLKSLSLFEKSIQDKFFKNFNDITQSVLIGQVVVGIIQGIAAGIGYFAVGAPNALLLTILTVIVGVIPIIGPWLVWIPVDIYLFVAGKTGAGIILLIYGLFFINWIDAIIRPMIVSRRSEINHAIVLVGMIGGIFVLGVIGIIIGPLILAYVFLVLEIYKKHNVEDNIIFKKPEKVLNHRLKF